MKRRLDGVPGWLALNAPLVLAAIGLLAGCTTFASQHEKRADALLQPTVGNQARGTVTLAERPDGVQVTYNFAGLPPNSDHALQIHERGDLGNIHADANGVAAGFITAPDVALDGVRSVLGRSVLVHRDPGDPAFPQHGAGPALACGVVRQ